MNSYQTEISMNLCWTYFFTDSCLRNVEQKTVGFKILNEEILDKEFDVFKIFIFIMLNRNFDGVMSNRNYIEQKF